MTMRRTWPWMLACVCAPAWGSAPVWLGPGDFQSVVPPTATGAAAHVGRFSIDPVPVTNAQFLDFVRAHPRWRRGQVPLLLADADYLSHWASPVALGAAAAADQPVTRVSWFAARAYCATKGGRLPGWYEWEFAAAADGQRPDARADPAWRSRILDWYARPADASLPAVGQGPPNYYGIRDLHGLVWEWVEDFNALTVSGDSREQGDPDRLRFCGAGATGLQDRENYAVLMRVALLSSLDGRSTARSLGFRCAYGGVP